MRNIAIGVSRGNYWVWAVGFVLAIAFSAAIYAVLSDHAEIAETVTGTDGQRGYQFTLTADNEKAALDFLAVNVPCRFDVMSIRQDAGTFTGLVRCQ